MTRLGSAISRTDVTCSMPPAPSEITRDDLLAFLKREGCRVSPYQLLRWHDWGLLPQPRREGLGRGKGTASYYPRTAALQARTLARLLAKRRSLRQAGWELWVLGFPVTAWARELLLGDLEEHQRQLQKMERSRKRGGQLLQPRARQRRSGHLVQMQKLAGRDAMPRLMQMLVAFQLGTLKSVDYAEEDWDLLQGAALHELWPDIATAVDLPSPAEVAKELAQLSPAISISRTIAALKRVPDRQLEQYRNELQWLFEAITPPDEQAAVRISPEEFLSFFKTRHVHPDGDRNYRAWMRDLGVSRPPVSPLQRWRAAFRPVATTPTPSTS